MPYTSGSAATVDALLVAIESAATAAGWTKNRSGALGSGGLAGRESLLSNGSAYFTLRSLASFNAYAVDTSLNADGPCLIIRGATGFDDGSAWDAQPGISYAGNAGFRVEMIGLGPIPVEKAAVANTPIAWPAPYHLFTFSDPAAVVCVIRMSVTQYQWLMFGSIEKHGTWTGGHFYAASSFIHNTSGGVFPTFPNFLINGASWWSPLAPFHDLRSSQNAGDGARRGSNSRLYCAGLTGFTNDWTYSTEVQPNLNGDEHYRFAKANVFSNPLNNRSPNVYNQIGVMTPFWLMTQRDANVCSLGSLAHVRQIPLDNFNAEDVFALGSDQWMVFPYLEKGGVTGRYGWAIKYEP